MSEAYYRLNTLTSEVRRNVVTLMLSRVTGGEPEFMRRDEIECMHQFAEDVIYPSPNKEE